MSIYNEYESDRTHSFACGVVTFPSFEEWAKVKYGNYLLLLSLLSLTLVLL